MSVRPEVHAALALAALALAARHRKTASHWNWTRHRRQKQLVDKHTSKAQKHMSRAARLAGEGDT